MRLNPLNQPNSFSPFSRAARPIISVFNSPSPACVGEGVGGEGILLCFIMLLAACTPAQPPPSLSATPGAAVVVTRDTYRNDLFSVEYPSGWRVVTSPAGAPPA